MSADPRSVYTKPGLQSVQHKSIEVVFGPGNDQQASSHLPNYSRSLHKPEAAQELAQELGRMRAKDAALRMSEL